jgi:integrase
MEEEQMAIRKRRDRWLVEIYDPETRGKRWVGSYLSRREAKEAFALAVLERDKPPSALTVDEFAATWVERYPRAKESTNRHHAEAIRLVARDFEGRPMEAVTRPEARQYALKHVSRWKVVRAMFSDAVRDRLIEANPFTELRLPESRGRKDLIVPTEAEIDQLVEFAQWRWKEYGRRVYGPMIELAAYTGMRPGELHALRWTDVDFNAETLTVERQYNTHISKFTAPKNGKVRTLALHPRAAGAIGRMPQVREEICSSPQGKMFTGRISAYYWDPVRTKLGRPELEWYALRHYFGTYLARLGPSRGIGPIEIAQAMGHQDGGKLAMERYIHLADVDARKTLRKAWADETTPELRSVSGAELGQEARDA